jgi:hypothetical protein
VTENETGLAEETARAMRALAGTVTDAPPLRLTPRRDARAPRLSRPRRWTLWAVPLAAAVAVIALAVVLVVVRDLPNGRAPRPIAPSTGTVPRYYLEPEQTCSLNCGPTRLVVRDTFTGATLAAIPPPGGATFMAVSGGADDRTFVADTIGYSVDIASPEPATWYRITLSPGSSSPAKLTRLPIPAGPAGSGVESIALSASGLELAVTYHLGPATPGQPVRTPGTTVLRIYSTTTGRLLHSWSTGQQVLFGANPYTYGKQVNDQLQWVDGDRGVAFTSRPRLKNSNDGTDADYQYATVRVLNVASGGSDLIADSPLVWSTTTIGSRTQAACDGDSAPWLTPQGKTVLCTDEANRKSGSGASSHDIYTFTWLVYETSAPKAARALYKASVITLPGLYGGPTARVLWASASASTLIIGWTVDDAMSADTHFGIVSHGEFIRLPTPPTLEPFAASSDIAW